MGCYQTRRRLTTGVTTVWFLTTVASFVLEKFPVCVEGFPTLVTSKRLVCGVCPLMFFEIAQVVESLTT